MEQIFKPDLVNLPWATLLTLASGYAGYYVANVGIRDHHKPIDVIFSALVFGFFSAFAYNICLVIYTTSILWASVAAFSFAVALGGVWSRFGRGLLEKMLRGAKITYADDLPSAWIALFSKKLEATQLTIKLKDGWWLKCEDLSKFRTKPNGPCTLGFKGDILMYITHVQAPSEKTFSPADSVLDQEWGDEITYIPADQIVRIDFRRKT